MDSFTLTCLQSLGEILATDEAISNYFSELPAPSYCYSRYTDWVLPYLNSQRADAQKYINATGTEEKIQKINKIQKMFETYQESVKQIENPFVIIEAVGEKLLKEIQVDENIKI